MATINFKFANISELNFGVTMQELTAAEGLATYINENRMKESFIKTEEEFAQIIGLPFNEENESAVYYAVNVCKRLFPHHIQYK